MFKNKNEMKEYIASLYDDKLLELVNESSQNYFLDYAKEAIENEEFYIAENCYKIVLDINPENQEAKKRLKEIHKIIDKQNNHLLDKLITLANNIKNKIVIPPPLSRTTFASKSNKSLTDDVLKDKFDIQNEDDIEPVIEFMELIIDNTETDKIAINDFILSVKKIAEKNNANKELITKMLNFINSLK